MVEKISVQIALEGTEEIKRQLAGVSDAGKKCFEDISAAAAQVGGFDKLDPTIVAKKFAEFGITAKSEIDKITAALQQARQVEGMVSGVQNLENSFRSLGNTGQSEIRKIISAAKSIGRLEAVVGGVTALESGFYAAAIAARALNAALAFGPIGLTITAIAVAAVALTKAFLSAADAINRIDAEAIKLGTTVEQFDKMRQGLLRAGISADAITAGIQHFKTELDRIQLDRVQQAFEKAQKSIAAGWFPAVEQIKILKEAANGIGPAAEAARRSLDQLGMPFIDKVTPAFEAMTRGAGTVMQVIPQIVSQLNNLPTAGERAQLITMTFEKIAAESGGVVQGFENIVRAAQQMPDSIERNNAILKLFGDQLGTQLIQALRTGSVDLEKFRTQLTQGTATDAARIEQNLNKIKSAFSEVLTTLPIQTVSKGLQQVADSVQATADKIGKISWKEFETGATSAFASVTGGINATSGAMDQLIAKIKEAIKELARLKAPTAGDVGLPFASGGLVGGVGTGTSDSNIAWVSRGEHIMPARAVAQPGVLMFLEALRRSGGDLSRILDGMGRFALGGLVPSMASLPAFAEGGVVNGRRMLTLNIEGRSFTGLSVPESTAQSLERFAVYSQFASTGRKPSWKR